MSKPQPVSLSVEQKNILFKTYIAYAKQILSKHYSKLADLKNNNDFIECWLNYFITKFNPEIDNHEAKISEAEKNCNKIISVSKQKDEMQFFLNLIKATVRTNFFIKRIQDAGNSLVAIKIKGELVPELPFPVTFAEIFVYSNDFEAIHLRFGPVARGGFRWSTRTDDFRTEVLGLMKAQTAKNSIIVPTGAKGGFVLKTEDQSQDTAIACYKNFIRSLLDLTDNIIDGNIIKNPATVCYDGNDHYIVAAADKGTATFSDYANQISAEYKFHLADAFASGGTNGYDHKKLGITSRGAWKSVECHCAELGIDIKTKPLTVVGIGSMNGDVFGNGLIYSDNLKLIAAFNHESIFVDPNPDVKISYQERLRLFNEVRSHWTEYNKDLISAGGGIFERFGPDINISPEMASLFNLKADTQINPEKLIVAIMKSKFDLLWNGGIGTFIKSSKETHADVADKFNDLIRINGSECGARMIGEGGNIGITPLGRIEYSLSGGRCNTDAIDNSGGVSCSDHEVNIKMLLNKLVNEGKLTMEKRNSMLEAMQSQVVKDILRDNYLQNQLISMSQYEFAQEPETYWPLYNHLFNQLQAEGWFAERSQLTLPTESEITQRGKTKSDLTRPEFSTVLSYVKLSLCKHLLAIELDNEIKAGNLKWEEYNFPSYLKNYFPPQISSSFPEALRPGYHPLSKNISLTVLTSEIINRLGITSVLQTITAKATVKDYVKLINSYAMIKSSSSIEKLWQTIDALTNVSKKIATSATIAHSYISAIKRILKGDDENAVIKEFEGKLKAINLSEPVKL